jgi:3-phenylpropionate/trans-cinnamate dioxygenase ferredoxin reductase component
VKRHYPFLIIGGGMAGDAAVRGIRQIEPDQPIGLIGQESDPPYNRPPLSKGLWKPGPRPMPLARIWRGTESLGVDMHLGRKAVRLDLANKQITDDQGEEYTYDRLLLATGGDPIRLRDQPKSDRVVYFRTLADYQRVRAMAEQRQRFAVIGGGFIGSEMAAALAALGKEVVMIFPESGIGARVLPDEISQHLNGVFRQHGIRVLEGQLVQSIQPGDQRVIVKTDQGERLEIEGVVAGLGIRPNTTLAEQAGLQVSDGIEVDAFLRTNRPEIYAAGDAANFFSPVLQKRMRVEHEENANQMGMIAGQNMAGGSERYHLLPSVYSTLFDYNYDAVGELNPAHKIVYDWQEPYKKGTIYYMDQERVRGVLLWNISRGLDAARQIIAEPGPIHPDDLKGRITG